MSILITGNRGFIASGLEGDGIDIKDGIDIVTYKAQKQYDVVIHAAALTSVTESMRSPKAYYRTNVQGTLNMVQQHPEAHFIYLSTAGIYGEGTKHTVKSRVNPTSVYTKTKLYGENIIKEFAKSYVILRLTNVVGEGERGEPNVYQIFEREEVLPIYGDGLQTRDFVTVEHVRKVIMKCVNLNGTFNVGSGVSKTIRQVAEEFNKPMKFLPARPEEIRHSGVADAFNLNS